MPPTTQAVSCRSRIELLSRLRFTNQTRMSNWNRFGRQRLAEPARHTSRIRIREIAGELSNDRGPRAGLKYLARGGRNENRKLRCEAARLMERVSARRLPYEEQKRETKTSFRGQSNATLKRPPPKMGRPMGPCCSSAKRSGFLAKTESGAGVLAHSAGPAIELQKQGVAVVVPTLLVARQAQQEPLPERFFFFAGC